MCRFVSRKAFVFSKFFSDWFECDKLLNNIHTFNLDVMSIQYKSIEQYYSAHNSFVWLNQPIDKFIVQAQLHVNKKKCNQWMIQKSVSSIPSMTIDIQVTWFFALLFICVDVTVFSSYVMHALHPLKHTQPRNHTFHYFPFVFRFSRLHYWRAAIHQLTTRIRDVMRACNIKRVRLTNSNN